MVSTKVAGATKRCVSSGVGFWQTKPAVSPALIVDADVDARHVTPLLMQAIQQLGRQYPARMRSLTAERDAGLVQDDLLAALSAAFAAVGLVVASVGVHGVLSVAAARRWLEIGIRLALGADRLDILRSVVGWAPALVGAGLAARLACDQRPARRVPPGSVAGRRATQFQ
jgi:hypothetical protein